MIGSASWVDRPSRPETSTKLRRGVRATVAQCPRASGHAPKLAAANVEHGGAEEAEMCVHDHHRDAYTETRGVVLLTCAI